MNAEPDRQSFIDPPFAVAPDVVFDIPPPPSLNRARKIDWKNKPKVDDWRAQADRAIMASGQYRTAKRTALPERYELTIILDESQTRMDLGNAEKLLNDYLKRIEIVADDGPKYCRQVLIKFGEAPRGCRLIVRGAA